MNPLHKKAATVLEDCDYGEAYTNTIDGSQHILRNSKIQPLSYDKCGTDEATVESYKQLGVLVDNYHSNKMYNGSKSMWEFFWFLEYRESLSHWENHVATVNACLQADIDKGRL